ncbi:ancylostoma secreted protein-like [Ischnura elegans]|uniref:ancylostoma secreted protein-like n=1 Tax=Ischnura elegans TaxID=197161 RepID=UPI001ED88833|nr:ancylostoma secreted protein-like [Ischnura elegans]
MSSILVCELLCLHILFGLTTVSADICECKDDAGIMCLYPDTKPGPNCKDYKANLFTDKEREQVVKKMNEYRDRVAKGKETLGNPGPQPPALDMMTVTWDSYLETTAQRYANQCIFEHTPGACRKTDLYQIGENLGWGKGMTHDTYFLDHIDSWYKEVKDFPSYLVDNYDPSQIKSGKMIGHYAQMVNGKTYHIGCGKARYGDEDILVCHFGPTIYAYQPLYTRGQATYSKMTFWMFFVVIFVGVSFVSSKDCECSAHIFCLYPSKTPGPACNDFKYSGFSEEEKKVVIHKMNEYRSKVALGMEKRGNPGPQPQAADMMELTWNDYLASTAQRYADQCIFQHSVGWCRKNEKYSIGENLGWDRGHMTNTTYLLHIDMWYNEVKDFPSFLVGSYNPARVSLPPNVQIGHYAQFINAKTYDVGCGKSKWGEENILVCHYGPTVFVDLPLYTQGPPASMCSNGKKSPYKGLCGSDSNSGSGYINLDASRFPKSCSRGLRPSCVAYIISLFWLYAACIYFF